MKTRKCYSIGRAKTSSIYLKVIIIYRYIFGGFGILCILLVLNFVRASQLMIFIGLFAIFNFYKYSILCFCANPQKYKTLVLANNCHLKVGGFVLLTFIEMVRLTLNEVAQYKNAYVELTFACPML